MEKAKNIQELYGKKVFTDQLMKEKLPKDVYKAIHQTSKYGIHLKLDVANTVAAAMKEWAIENGATHFTHWFQPMTGVTAEKHDSFLSLHKSGVLMEFSGKELVKGEPDASSFPSGGLRATFEARGYTAWDPSSPAFIKDGTLYIPTAFSSYNGEALDKKTPLLRSMEALNNESVKILHLLGYDDVTHIDTTIGSEQEYFLVDKELYKKRKDLVLTGRTLLGAPASKGQEMDDHYFGVLKPKVSAFMHDLDEELWELGIPAKTKHNEVAPSQHELAPIFETANVAVDHNQLTMEVMKKVADRHNLACLLHEKPFEGVNGSGKHNNWSIVTNTGVNLLNPGSEPDKNIPFLIFLLATIEAVDNYQDLLRISVASAGNDHRLGANEAPPAIMSIFLGDELVKVLKAIDKGVEYQGEGKTQFEIGATVLPHFTKDKTDRNRTSPFAFTGNKFEFRMPGSSLSVADPNIILNTAVAESLSHMYEVLKEDSSEEAVYKLLKDTLDEHKRILFNGNGYTDEWVEEAHKRGLLNLKSLPDAVPELLNDKNKTLFSKHHVFSETELESRYEIYLENYIKTLHIEALTLLDMVKRDFTPTLVKYMNTLATEISNKQRVIKTGATMETKLLVALDRASNNLSIAIDELEENLVYADSHEDILENARSYHDLILTGMEEVRKYVDKAESLIPEDELPYPTYDELLFSLR